VTKDGDAIKFVDVARREFWFYGPVDSSASPSAITSWVLSRDRLTWVQDGDIKLDEFSDLTKHLNVPKAQLVFPLVHSKESQTIYIVLRELCDTRKAFQITVDMVSKKITDVTCYSLRTSVSIGDVTATQPAATSSTMHYHSSLWNSPCITTSSFLLLHPFWLSLTVLPVALVNLINDSCLMSNYWHFQRA
jgi:hypothetical protein